MRARESDAAIRGISVLIVDRDATSARQLQSILEGSGCSVVAVSDVSKAVMTARMRTAPQVVIIDIDTTRARPTEAVLRIRGDGSGVRPVYIGSPDHVDLARELWLFPLLVKPFSAAALLHAIQSAVIYPQSVRGSESPP